MSELITNNKQTNVRLNLLATASAIVLTACVATGKEVQAADRPTIWIEGGMDLDNITGSNETFVPPLDSITTNGFQDTPTAVNFLGQGSGGFPSFTDMENVLGRSVGGEGSLSFQPRGSDWVFNISARYGRVQTRRHILDRQVVTGNQAFVTPPGGSRHLATPYYNNYVDQSTGNTESHTIVDFKVGKDVGLGLFGKNTESVFSFGARYVHMNMTSKGHSYALPGERFYLIKTTFIGYKYTFAGIHQNSASVLERYSDFHAIGPSFSWSNTTGLWGDVADGQIALDWGANAAILFGRQKAKVGRDATVHKSQDMLVHNLLFGTTQRSLQQISSSTDAAQRTQTRRVTVPNLGGFAALAYRFPNAKLSVGYRADFFFGAMDRGLDTHQSVTTGYHGPYATISIGLGG